MSDEFIPPMPEDPAERSAFDFAGLTPDDVEMPDSTEFDMPNMTAAKETKARWWERNSKPPKRPGRPSAKKVKPVLPTPRGGLKAALENFYTSAGMAIMPFDPSCARIILQNAPKCAETMDELAKTNPAVRRVLIGLVTTSVIGAVVTAHAPIIMAICLHHIPALRERQEKMVGEMAEMFANMNFPAPPAEESNGE